MKRPKASCDCDHQRSDFQSPAVATPEAFGSLRELDRRRRLFQRMRTDQLKTLQAFVRRIATPPDATPAQRKAINARASKIVAGWLRMKPIASESSDVCEIARPIILAASLGLRSNAREEARFAKSMEAIAGGLDAWARWGSLERGLGLLNFAKILADAGDPAGYPSVACLWKRMGLSVHDGRRQGNPEDKRDAAEWMRHGYNPERRATMHLVGECLIKARNPTYTEIYREAKAAAEARPDFFKTKLHRHRHAMRLMEKRLLRDFWRVFNLSDEQSIGEAA